MHQYSSGHEAHNFQWETYCMAFTALNLVSSTLLHFAISTMPLSLYTTQRKLIILFARYVGLDAGMLAVQIYAFLLYSSQGST